MPLIDGEVLAAIEEIMSSQERLEGLHAWLAENEPDLVRWSRIHGMNQTSLPNTLIPREIAGVLADRLAGNFQMGYMMAVLGNSRQYTGSIGIDDFRGTFGSNASAAYEAFIAGKLPDKYYTKEFLDRDEFKHIPKDVERALKNYEKVHGEKSAQESRLDLAKIFEGAMGEDNGSEGEGSSNIETGGAVL